MIKPATDIERLREVFYRVFKSRDPFSPAGREEFPVRVMLYPTYGYYLETEQFRALIGAVHESGEREFFISLVEAETDPFSFQSWGPGWDSHWVCQEPTLEEYMKTILPVENAIYSSSGSWGILVSHEDHALLVCHPTFWDAFQRLYPNWRQDLEQFIELWHYHERERGIDVGWLKPFLDHLVPAPP